jgi:hypothetical protein
MQFLSARLGFRQPHDGGISGFVARPVRAGGFSQGLGAAFHVQNVVHDLEGEPDGAAVLFQRLNLYRADIGLGPGPEQHRGLN